ncbi:MAG: nuclear transport factor 2 family protein [Acidimicrobiia bacterium]
MTTAEDRDEILQVLYRYNHAFDSGDADEWAGTFTEDAVFNAAGRVMNGREELRTFAGGAGGGGRRHLLMNPVIDVEGDTAHVRAYVVLLRDGAIGAVGGYDDELARTAEGWRIAKRTFTVEQRADAPA